MGNVQGDESQEFEIPMKTVTRSLPGQWNGRNEAEMYRTLGESLHS